ncbi:3-hydroxyacyl-CoA dehydrogenase family protein [Streptomyces sporangiiformans]|uniref:3-hydroxyacyl-CoA dehydrogenase family protein n=1 Tax=Streptomyces sporangiiformans TaxID=2315329 RepID=A0A505D769_9ACTN|nr:3-hydroxyacyl-CoA dehydrogenase family protein [Streptomyces sporangiiformans]TPQ18142.1 3-hydroxyacyl-CoA dehydrogenase family protein [Streptomyces sporangiiformans]
MTIRQQVGVIGAGTMVVGIAYVFAARGCEVTLAEPEPARAEKALETVRAQAARARERGRLTSAQAGQLPGRARTVSAVDELPEEMDLVVEAVPERPELKGQVLAAAEERRPLVLAGNTSGLSIDDLAAPLRRPGDFLGLHFFNPVWSMPLVEIVRGTRTAERTLKRAREAAGLIGKETIVVRDSPGFATSRLGVAIGLEAMRMLQDGVASAEDIDRAMELGYRHPMGPLRLTDLVGLDVRLDIASHLAETYGPRFEPPRILLDKVAAGDLGRKTGRGFYDWGET